MFFIRLFCEQHGLEIQPLSKLIGCDAVNGTEIEYEGFVELNFQVPGRNFSEDHLFLVVPPIEYHKEIPAIVGTYVLDRFIEYLKDICNRSDLLIQYICILQYILVYFRS